MDDRSERLLAEAHPDLARVIRGADQLPQPFLVVYGIRTLAAEREAVATGHSETLHSRHLPDARYGGVAMAVDVAALIDGEPNFAAGREAEIFGLISSQVLRSATALGIKVQWGGAAIGAWTDGQVSHFRDWGHFQLDPSAYPA